MSQEASPHDLPWSQIVDPYNGGVPIISDERELSRKEMFHKEMDRSQSKLKRANSKRKAQDRTTSRHIDKYVHQASATLKHEVSEDSTDGSFVTEIPLNFSTISPDENMLDDPAKLDEFSDKLGKALAK